MNQDNLFKQYKETLKEGGEEEKSAENKNGFEFTYNPFRLQDAIGEKNAKKAWIEYQKLKADGIEADELVHKILNKARDVLAAKRGAIAKDLGLKDFPFSKSKKDSKNWEDKSLEDFYTELIFVFHESRMGRVELDVALEKIILSI